MAFYCEVNWMRFSLQDNNVERAADWIFSHAQELDQSMETEQAAGGDTQNPNNYRDGPESMF